MNQPSNRYLALLRGINVGGNNIIAKEDLKLCFENLGHVNVRTYIQSGNVLFRSTETRVGPLTETIESGLSDRFDYGARAVVLSHRKYRSAVDAAPPSWGEGTDDKHYALFTLKGVSASRVVAKLPPPVDELETVTAGPGVIFWSASKQYATRTTLMKVAKNPVYKELTVRNHNTIYKLLELFETI